MPDAARRGDHHICPAKGDLSAPTVPRVDPATIPKDGSPPPIPIHPEPVPPQTGTPHDGGPILPKCSPNVETNDKAAARATDALSCEHVHLKNYIVTGSGSVEINGKLAARVTDRTMHPPVGHIDKGSRNVEIGGPTKGAILGSAAATEACEAARDGRDKEAKYPEGDVRAGQPINPTGAGQSYNNCGLESSRQLINRVRAAGGLDPLSEQELFLAAVDGRQAERKPNDLRSSGFTSPDARVSILNANGVDASRVFAGSPEELAPFLADGHGVLVDVYASDLWSADASKAANLAHMSNTGPHTVVLTGIEYDDQGKPINAIVNDTGQGTCGEKIPIERLRGALLGNNGQIVTKNPLW